MLQLSAHALRPVVIRHVDYDISSVGYESAGDISEGILEADRRRELYSVGFEYHGLVSLQPPLVVVGKEEIVEPGKLFLIGEMLGERHQMLLAVRSLYLAVIEKDDSVVVRPVPASVLIVRRKRGISQHSLRIACDKRHSEILSEADELLNKLCCVGVDGTALRVVHVPCDGGNERRLAPDHCIGISLGHRLKREAPEIVEVVEVCCVSALP